MPRWPQLASESCVQESVWSYHLIHGCFQKSGMFLQNGWWKDWKTPFFNGWCGLFGSTSTWIYKYSVPLLWTFLSLSPNPTLFLDIELSDAGLRSKVPSQKEPKNCSPFWTTENIRWFFTNPFEKYGERQIGSWNLKDRDENFENKKKLPPPRSITLPETNTWKSDAWETTSFPLGGKSAHVQRPSCCGR